MTLPTNEGFVVWFGRTRNLGGRAVRIRTFSPRALTGEYSSVNAGPPFVFVFEVQGLPEISLTFADSEPYQDRVERLETAIHGLAANSADDTP